MTSSNNVVVPDRQPFDGMDYVRLDATVQTMLEQSNVNFKDNVATPGDLPMSGNTIDDFRLVISNGFVYRWDGSAWVKPAVMIPNKTLYVGDFPVFTGSGTDDLNVSTVYTGPYPNTYTVTIDGTGFPDTFSWTSTAGGSGSLIPCSNNGTLLDNGVYVDFNNTTGHTLGDSWTINIIPIQTAFVNGTLLGGIGTGIGDVYQDNTNNIVGVNLFGNFNGSPDGAIRGLVSLGSGIRGFSNVNRDQNDMNYGIQVGNGVVSRSLNLDTAGGLTYQRSNNGRYTFPANSGNPGEVLTTDGNNSLYWSVGGGSGLTGYTTVSNVGLGLQTAVDGAGNGNVWLGYQAGKGVNSGSNNTLVGNQVVSANVPSLTKSVIIGSNVNLYAWGGGSDITAIGTDTISGSGLGNGSVSVGYQANAISTYAIAIGNGSSASATSSIAIGDGASTVGRIGSIALGSKATNTQAGEIVIGSFTNPINTLMLGSGWNSGYIATPVKIYASQASGVDLPGSSLNMYAGQSTGSGIGGGFYVYTSPTAGVPGSALNPYTIGLQILAGPSRISVIGDVSDTFNKNKIVINDFASQNFVQTPGTFQVQNPLGQEIMHLDMSSGAGFYIATIGDVNGLGNGTYSKVDDGTKTISNLGSMVYKWRDGGNSTPITIVQGDYGITPGSGSIGATFNLPDSSTLVDGTTFIVKDEYNLVPGGGSISVAPFGTDTIDQVNAAYNFTTTGQSVTLSLNKATGNRRII